jgi:ribosome biogenesis GTPase
MDAKYSLKDFGLDARTEEAANARSVPRDSLGRVISDHGIRVIVRTERGDESAALRGATRDNYREGERPIVGDWVVLRDNPEDSLLRLVTEVLPRHSFISRKSAGRDSSDQFVAANVNRAFIVVAVDDINVRRLERFVTIVRDGGVEPIIVISKTDTAPTWPALAEELRRELGDIRVVGTSSVTGEGLDAVTALLLPGETSVLIGASGAGKSSLLNLWTSGPAQRVAEVRDDGRGRHATTARTLFRLPSGALLIDTPGIREVGVATDEEGVDATFDDVIALTAACRYSDCRHQKEPGCAVRSAIESGALSRDRLEAWRRLSTESSATRALDRQREAKATAKAIRKRLRAKGRED